MQPLRKVALRRVGPRDRRPLAERRDVRDEGADLPFAKQDSRATRLDAQPGQRHVTGAEVEVGGERADAPEAWRLGRLHLLDAQRGAAGGARTRDARAVRAVARHAVLAIQALALPDERAGRRRGRRRGRHGCERERGREVKAPPCHDCLHETSTTEATPSSTTMTRKMRFAAIAATAKSWSLPMGGGLW